VSTPERAPAQAGPTLRPARTEATRHKLFAASMEIIGERGPHSVTVEEIAAAAGVSKGSVYYNFGSKSEMIGQLLRFGGDILMDRLGRLADRPDPRQALAAMVGEALDFLDEYPSFAQLWVSEMWHSASEWRPTLSRMRGEVIDLVRAAVTRIDPSGPDEDLDTLATAVFGATLALGRDRHSFHPERSRDACVRAVMRSVAPAARP